MDPQKVVLWSAGKSSVIYEKSLGSTALLTRTLKKVLSVQAPNA